MRFSVLLCCNFDFFTVKINEIQALSRRAEFLDTSVILLSKPLPSYFMESRVMISNIPRMDVHIHFLCYYNIRPPYHLFVKLVLMLGECQTRSILPHCFMAQPFLAILSATYLSKKNFS